MAPGVLQAEESELNSSLPPLITCNCAPCTHTLCTALSSPTSWPCLQCHLLQPVDEYFFRCAAEALVRPAELPAPALEPVFCAAAAAPVHAPANAGGVEPSAITLLQEGQRKVIVLEVKMDAGAGCGSRQQRERLRVGDGEKGVGCRERGAHRKGPQVV